MNKKSQYFYLLLLILLPLVFMIIIQLISVNKQYKRAQGHLDFSISQAMNSAKYQFSVWNSHTSGTNDASSYDTYYINTDSTFSFMISQSAQKYPLLKFKPDSILPAFRKQQFLDFKEELENTKFSDNPSLHEFYLFRSIQYCKGCTDTISSVASVFPVDSLIKSEIKKQGVHLEPEIAFYKIQEEKYSHLTSESDSLLFNQTRFKYIFTESEEVRILLPDEIWFLFYDIFSSILSALILILISLFCFIWARKIIIRKKQLEEEKSNFIDNVTHELKTPIATISFAVANIENDAMAKKSEPIKQFAKVIKQENDRLNDNVEKVLQIATSQKKDFELKLKKVNIHEIINALCETYSLRLKEGDSIKCELNAAHAEVEGDEFHLRNMVSNLIDNAIKYSVERIEINLSTESDDQGMYIKVADRGKGIEKEHQAMIFTKFYRVSSGNVHNVKGFGLGLSYVKEMVEKHNGTVKVNSRIGRGSTFEVFLPFNTSSINN